MLKAEIIHQFGGFGEKMKENIPQKDLPIIPELPPINPDPNPEVGKCGKCGLVLRQQMWYSCPHDNCPCFPKPRM